MDNQILINNKFGYGIFPSPRIDKSKKPVIL